MVSTSVFLSSISVKQSDQLNKEGGPQCTGGSAQQDGQILKKWTKVLNKYNAIWYSASVCPVPQQNYIIKQTRIGV